MESLDITCGEPFSGFRKKRQTATDTLNIMFNLTINIGLSECTEVNCQDKYDKLVEVQYD